MVSLDKSKAILVVEDSTPDYESILRAFKKMGINNPVYRCECGEDALDYLRQTNKYQDAEKAPRPGIVLLDLNLPGLDGRSVLKQIKNDSKLRAIPVIVLTTSTSDKDIEECYNNGANSYMVKPVDWEKFLESMRSLKEFWLQTAVLPNKEAFI
ncbi:MAG: response regulator [Proteobacteria bacterium]|nr:response regulator [Pseudomonadota bacterium]